MRELLEILVTILGGLGIFLLGMKHLSEGLQATAGSGLRNFMAHATGHRIVGVGTGIFSTILVQSSSIITVMLVGFVSSALMTLPQAFSVLIGANIGTTATVWIIAYAPNPQMLGFIGIGLGGIFYFFFRGDRIRNLGLTFVGLGLVFLGLYFMSKGVAPIRNNPAIAQFFQKMDAGDVSAGIYNYWGAIKIAFSAMVLTAVIQSSAATIMIAMALAQQGLISYEVAIAVLFGANIGTTATGWIAAIGGTADAKRTALSHTLSNLIGSIVLIPFFPLFVKAGQAIFPNWHETTEILVSGRMMPAFTHMMAPIAVTDTIFATCRGIIFFPLVKPFCRLIEAIIHQPENEKPHLSTLKASLHLSPVIACDQAMLEIGFMRDSALDCLACFKKVITGESNRDVETHITHREDILDNVQKEVTDFLSSVMSKRLDHDTAERCRRLLRLTDELESISDEPARMLRVVKRLRNQKQKISDISAGVLLDVHERVYAFAEKISPWIRAPRPMNLIDVKWATNESSEIHEFIRTCRKAQLGRVGADDPGSSVRVLGELDIINGYERVRSYYTNIAETLAGGKK